MAYISEYDIKHLKYEYYQSRIDEYESTPETRLLHRGIARGLEIALVKIGILNDELDKISQKAYHQAMKATIEG